MIHFRHKAAKFSIYFVLAYLLTVLQNTPRLFAIGGIKPVLVAGLVVSVAMVEGEFSGGLFGAVAGLLTDFFSYNKFGYNGLMFFVCCVCIGLLVQSLMRPVPFNCFLYSFLIVLVTDTINFFFRFFITGVEDAFLLYPTLYLPTALYTAVVALPIYWLVRKIHVRYKKLMEA